MGNGQGYQPTTISRMVAIWLIVVLLPRCAGVLLCCCVSNPIVTARGAGPILIKNKTREKGVRDFLGKIMRNQRRILYLIYIRTT